MMKESKLSMDPEVAVRERKFEFVLVIGLPVAWQLVLTSTGIVRTTALIVFAVSPIAIVLTGTRGAFLADNTDCRIVFCCCALSVVRLAWV